MRAGIPQRGCTARHRGLLASWLIWRFRQPCATAGRRPCAAQAGRQQAHRRVCTRSPFRPNESDCPRCGLTAWAQRRTTGAAISGADLMDSTPIFDIKPYLAYTDSHPEARGGFALTTDAVRVECPAQLLEKLPEERRQTLLNVLAQDPRPGYQHEAGRVYGFPFAGFEVKFTVEGDLLTVRQIESR
ncbi:MAG: TrmO family methyltransferase [Butyricicoccus sp.]